MNGTNGIADLRKELIVLLILVCAGTVPSRGQEAVSNATRLRVNRQEEKRGTAEDQRSKDDTPPHISLIVPEMDGKSYYRSETDKIDLIGEVTDESRIRFVSVNQEVRVVNETGIFTTTLSLSTGENSIRILAMDEFNNRTEKIITIDYIPPRVTLADRIRTESKYYGLIIGINEYMDKGIPDLDNPIRDADAVYRVLTSKYTFFPENIIMLKNPKRIDIIRELDKLRNTVSSSDNLLIFYAGHGYWDEEANIGYWLPSDANRETTAEWFRNSTLVDYIQAIKSNHTLLITDACFAGSIFKSRAVDMEREVAYESIFDLPSRKAMTSGSLTEVPDESAFIKYLLLRLNENDSTYLTSEELFSSLRMAVISNGKNVPRYGEIQNVGNEGGDFIFLKSE